MKKSVVITLDIEVELANLRLMIPDIMDKQLDDPEVVAFQKKVLDLKSRATSSLEDKKARLNTMSNLSHYGLFSISK
jgi:hypothetical protein